MQLLLVECPHLQIPLHGEHFGHAVGNRRSRCEYHAAAAVDFLDVLNLQKHIEGAFRRSLRQARDARHFRDVEKVFEKVRLVHKQPVNAKLLERECVVLLIVSNKQL